MAFPWFMSFIENVAVLLTTFVALITVVRAIDRFYDGRFRGWLRAYIGHVMIREDVEANRERIDVIHEGQKRTMGIQVAAVERIDEIARAICEDSEVEIGDFEQLDVEKIRREAYQADAAYPGEFTRGPDVDPADD